MALTPATTPTLVSALAPEVAIVNSGARKGAEPRTMALLLKQVGDVGVFQLHKNVREGAVNTEPARIANELEQCPASGCTCASTPMASTTRSKCRRATPSATTIPGNREPATPFTAARFRVSLMAELSPSAAREAATHASR